MYSAVKNRRRRRVLELACLAWSASPALAQTTASWLTPVSGSWNEPVKWSSSPFYPNNDNPPSTSYDVFIAAQGQKHVVYLNISAPTLNVSLNSLTLDSPDAMLEIYNGTL